MGAPRKFDHDECRARHAAGESMASLARGYGVSGTAVRRVVDDAFRERFDRASTEFNRAHRPLCLGRCGRRVWAYACPDHSGYCQTCAGIRNRTAEHGTEGKYRQGCRCAVCRTAASKARRDRRERGKVPCSNGCGRMVHGINRDYPDKPPECPSCANKRILETRPEPPHGTVTRYESKRFRCRCDICRAAMAEKNRRARERRMGCSA